MVERALLLAAGRGRRLRPLTDHVPKPVLPILDVPLAAWGLRAVGRTDLKLSLNVSFGRDELLRRLAPIVPQGLEVLVEEPEAYGTAGTLAALASRRAGGVLVVNADALTDLDPRRLLEGHAGTGAPATLAVQAVPSGADLEVRGGRVVRFIDRREEPDAAGHRFIGMAVYEPSALELLPSHRPAGLGESLFPLLVSRGELAVFEHEGYALDVGTPERYLQANLDVLNGAAPSPPLRPPGTFLVREEGRAYIGRDAQLSPASLGPSSVILSGATVERDARVERAVVWEGAVVPAYRHVSDAVWAFGTPL